ncbi:MAG: TonB-dependent receptor [Deltaproteobacteria bacterium]|nr:TonB-dependent receptor [Deltaproteobacteria bacterium]
MKSLSPAMKFVLRCFPLLLFFSLPLSAQASQYDNLLDMSLEELMDIEIVSASKKSEKIKEAPATVIVLSEEVIRRRGYTDLEQMLHDLPGFDISRGNGTVYSQIYQRGYRSNNTDRTLLLIDGVEENDLWKGTAWISRQYPITNIKRVEVVYGPASTIYGANAFAGVINIITKDPADIINKNSNFGIVSQVTYGSWNTAFTDITVAGKEKSISFTLTGRIYKSDEMDLSHYPDFDYDLSAYGRDYYGSKLGTGDAGLIDSAMALDEQGYYTGVAATNGKKPHYSNDTNDWLVNGKLFVNDFTFGFQTWRRNEGYGAWYRDDFESGPDNNGRWVPENTFIYAKYETDISDKLKFSSFTRFKNHTLSGDSQENYFIGYFNGEYDLANLTATDDTGAPIPAQPYWDTTWWYVTSRQLRTEFTLLYTHSEKFDLLTGLEYRLGSIQGTYVVSREKNPSETGFPRDEAGTDLPGGNHYDSRDIGLYAQATYTPVEDLHVVAGGRLDDNKIRESGGYGREFNPKAAVIYTPADFIFKAIYAEAFKDADNWTKYSTTKGRKLSNPTLQPEKAKNFEVSAGWRFTDNAFANIVAYRTSYSNVVGTVDVLYDGEHTTQHQAIGSLLIMGLQGTANYKYKNYDMYLNYTYTNPKNTQGDTDVRIGDIAAYQINAGINARFMEHLNFNLRMNHSGERKTGSKTTISENPYDKINAYTVFNGAVTYDNIIDGLSGQVTVNNIFDKKYYDPGVRSADGNYYAARLPQNERNFMVSLRYAF